MQIQPPKSYLCRHLFSSGHRCGSPALRGRFFCYYHQATRRPAPDPAIPRYPDAPLGPFALPVLEDRASVQLAISQVLARIASNDLDPKRARLLLFGLQIAIRALPRGPGPARDHLGRYSAEPQETREEIEVEQDPTYGPLAPIAELPTPETREARSTRLIEELRQKYETTPNQTIPNIQAEGRAPQTRVPHLQQTRPWEYHPAPPPKLPKKDPPPA